MVDLVHQSGRLFNRGIFRASPEPTMPAPPLDPPSRPTPSTSALVSASPQWLGLLPYLWSTGSSTTTPTKR